MNDHRSTSTAGLSPTTGTRCRTLAAPLTRLALALATIGAPTMSEAGNIAGRSVSLLDPADYGQVVVGGGRALDGTLRGSQLGTSVAGAGDMNGDGYSDLLLGAPNDEYFSRSGAAGAVFGAPHAAQSLDVRVLGSRGFLMWGADAQEQAGFSVTAVGDINGDGLSDVVVGAPRNNGVVGERVAAGIAYVVYGDPDPAPAVDLDLVALGIGGYAIRGSATTSFAGWAVTGLGDVNQDGFDEVVISQPFALSGAGEVHVIWGRASSGAVALPLAPGRGFTLTGQAVLDQAGYSIAGGGDINRDGYPDLIVGAPGRSYPSVANPAVLDGDVGSVYVRYLTPNMPARSSINEVPGFAIRGVDAGDRVGEWVASAGDFDGDGQPDVAFLFRERAYVTFESIQGGGSRSFVSISASTGNANAPLDEPASIAGVGDVTGDRIGDLVIGYPGVNGFGAGSAGAGAACVIPGRFGRAASIEVYQEEQTVCFFGTANLENAGRTVAAAGDVDGDGVGDFLIGAPGYDRRLEADGGVPQIIEDAGRAFIVSGRVADLMAPGISDARADLTLYSRQCRADNLADESGEPLGALGNQHNVAHPDTRMWLAPCALPGAANPIGQQYLASARLRRGASPSDFLEVGAAPVYWNLEWNGIPTTGVVSLRYADREIAQLVENGLEVWVKRSGGNYARAEARVFPDRNLIRLRLPTTGLWTIALRGPVAPATADLVASVSAPGIVSVGPRVEAAFDFTNLGPVATSARMTGVLSAGASNIQWRCVSSVVGLCPAPQTLGTALATALVRNLSAGESASLIASFTVAAGTQSLVLLGTTNSSTGTADSNNANNAAQVTIPVAGEPTDLQAFVTAPAQAQVDQSIQVTFDYFNNGPAATTARVSADLADGAADITWTCFSSAAGVCPQQLGAGPQASFQGVLPDGGIINLRASFRVTGARDTLLVTGNAITVDSTDSNVQNNAAQRSIAVSGLFDEDDIFQSGFE